ncbi:MAG: VIT1/CCC1 family predicted Fe2+/Mn2+ transporter [Candidatus Paceibacteria bacterium]|jgi:VIT1/CCC1 family predicted Fe2+/Mn2+ transporter
MKKIIHKYLPEFVYGSVDGVVTTVAIITGAVGAGLSSGIILILGLANVLADAWSMGSSEYLSSISEAEMEGVDHDNEGKTPLDKGLVTFASFVAVGLLPIIPFFFSIVFPGFIGSDVWVSMGAALFAFILIGYIGARVTKASRTKNIIRTVIVGSIAAFISFIVGYLLRGFA